VCTILLNALSDWKHWRMQVAIAPAVGGLTILLNTTALTDNSIFKVVQVLSCGVLSGWPNSTPTILIFYFLTFSTAAWGYVRPETVA
jgi:hypothetical protein